ncbi:hypothetical protein HMP0721_2008 [Pseudoramibacter alactolyticus ATCC 23263]|uniref:Uncharacterized protein n=1 Tax=Pseudoramibacter alactolyticus ATCC 23263 TaxID=887929 RepID=E6MJ23_9FIRM|nr:hypothetical protein HMP0721_2008 [Pseudoramibacter alactolyticus ATCC 23263]
MTAKRSFFSRSFEPIYFNLKKAHRPLIFFKFLFNRSFFWDKL